LQKANGVHPTHGGDPQLVDPPISRPSTAPRPEDLGSLDPRGSNTQENMSRAENVPNGDLSNGRPRLLRSKSDFGPRQQNKQSDGDAQTEDSGDSSWRMRHGFETQFTSEEYLNLVDEVSEIMKLLSHRAPVHLILTYFFRAFTYIMLTRSM
jgi:regulatory associated protein of mTOR